MSQVCLVYFLLGKWHACAASLEAWLMDTALCIPSRVAAIPFDPLDRSLNIPNVLCVQTMAQIAAKDMARRAAAVATPPGETFNVAVGIAGICATGCAIAAGWYATIADKKPKTFSPQWVAATAKYRAAQNQDPIRNQ
eukprot:CAMPEP_0181193106 /NCGR_PEP_ID=MMETSP1096-20121128/13641_1 /TAXON_ID=156174 ORGANISM="Chrysochromulina ericina, Strain CCMP281" /NCGR_SAMPLE_ID=MMETSP1096 /ASSEMBLY_ACC=CAM_ASM_000453 /LENGTH=137 /DNA_ID=CAMNT_0023282549 /DNA_START=7 /DNA_END=421 /DNA_ORIENTATION=+